MENQKGNLIRLTGLWEIKKRDGKVYYSGKLGHSARVLLFKNDYAMDERDPYFFLCLAPLKKKEESENLKDDVEPF